MPIKFTNTFVNGPRVTGVVVGPPLRRKDLYLENDEIFLKEISAVLLKKFWASFREIFEKYELVT